MSTSHRPLLFALLTGALSLIGCTRSRIADPHDAAVAFAAAVSSPSPDTVYDMLTPAAQASLSRADVRRLVETQKPELAASAAAVVADDARVHATARLRFDDGEEVALDLANGRFGITGGGTLPGGARTPEAALDELRRALARRSYTRLLRLLTPSTRGAIEQDLRTLVNGLERADTLPVRTSGDSASATTTGGHHVTLKREAGLWRVEDFD